MRNELIFVLLFVLGTICGCCSSPGFEQYRAKQTALREQWAISDARTASIDNLWKGGYGFNNPNVERIRQGLEPQNFDGSTGTKTKKGPLDAYVDDVVGYGIASVVTWPLKVVEDLSRKRR